MSVVYYFQNFSVRSADVINALLVKGCQAKITLVMEWELHVETTIRVVMVVDQARYVVLDFLFIFWLLLHDSHHVETSKQDPQVSHEVLQITPSTSRNEED